MPYEEHDAAQRVMRKLKWLTFGKDHFKARIKVLKELLQHHIEEENELFSKSEEILDEEKINQMGENYSEFKERRLSYLN